MKKFISMVIALAMMSSLVVTTAFADAFVPPAKVTVHTEANLADGDQTDTYVEETGHAVPDGYTLYAVSVYQSGLGDLENTKPGTGSTAKKQPTGFLPASMNFQFTFSAGDAEKIDDDNESDWFVISQYSFSTAYASNKATFNYDTWTNASAYPLNAKDGSSIAENEPIATFLIPVQGSVVGAVSAIFVMSKYESGVEQDIQVTATDTDITKEYSDGQAGTVEYNPTSLTIGSAAPVTPTYTITFKDWDNTELTGSGTYDEGATVTAPTPSRTGYTFTGWSPAFSGTAAADVTYTAQYTAIPVSSITLDKAALALQVGGTGSVAVSSVLPATALDKTYTWSTDAPGVATVEGGTVTATGIGTAHIRATANDGSGVYGECTVTVTEATPADIVPAVADKGTYTNATDGLYDAKGHAVVIDPERSYGAAKFENVVVDDGEYVYKVFVTGTNKTTGAEESASFDIANESLEITGVSVSFIAIVRSATRTITSVVLKAFKK